ncbi:MAG: hypothetical protein AB1489_15830 [Acidobacteriota bacterium]
MSEKDLPFFFDPNNDNPVSKPSEVSRKRRNYYDEYMMLATTSQFLTTINTISLYGDELSSYDSSDIAEMAERWRRAPLEYPPEQVQTLVKRLDEFRARIEANDERVSPSNMRRLFESVGTPESTSLERIIRFYLTRHEKSTTTRDKLDLIVTRWGSFRIPGAERMVVLRAERNLKQKLEKIFSELGLELDTGFQEGEVLNWLERYSESLLKVERMQDIVEKNYKTKLREFKLALGNFFYRPGVLAAIVDVNVMLHNIMQEFYLSERARLELYVDHAKRKTGELPPLPPDNTLFTLMSRAEEMRRILDETQAAIVAQQVVDQPQQTTNTTPEGAEAGKPSVEQLVSLLEQTLKRTNDLSQQIQQEITKIYDK